MSSAPDRFELYDPERYPDYVLRMPREIAVILRSLAARRIPIAVFGGRRYLFPSMVLQVTEEHFFLDPCGDERLNALAVERGVVCQGKLDGILLQFEAQPLQRVEHQGVLALAAPLPRAMLRLQRREFFRLKPPTPTWWCELPRSAIVPLSPQEAEQVKLKLRVLDLSVGGVALLFPPDVPTPAHGTQVPSARLILPPMEWLETAMEVRNVLPLDTPGPAKAVPMRVGLRFVGMPTAVANRLYRYLFELQRELLAARKTGLGVN